jgi:hypothetical protein
MRIYYPKIEKVKFADRRAKRTGECAYLGVSLLALEASVAAFSMRLPLRRLLLLRRVCLLERRRHRLG